LFVGAPHPLGGEAGDPATASSQDAGEALSLAWASPELQSSTEDHAASIRGFDMRLAPGETRFLRVEIAPGGSTPMHRTPYITDYLVAVSGELVLEMEDGTTEAVRAGDMMVQLGGWHTWRNEGDVPFVMAGVVVGIRTQVDVPGGVEMRTGTAS
jgi:quercetin dioxygenase-like cupin family protein